MSGRTGDDARRHEPQYEPPYEQDPKYSHAGNGTVNHHLDDQGPDGLDSDELALRRMLHHAVGEMEPRDGTLEHLRRAVPARRARKRQAVVGMAAAAIFVGTAVPALVHVSNSGGSTANPSIAGQASQTQGGAGDPTGSDGDASGTTGGAGQSADQGKSSGTGTDEGKDSGAATGSSSGADPAATSPADVPACTVQQLGSASAGVDVPDAAGTVYGTFRVLNVSADSCAVSGKVALTPTTQGAADAAKITVAEHVSGGPAANLPDPSLYVARLVLAPGSAYEVKFGWVPSESCPTDSGGGSGTGGGDTGSGDTGGGSSPSPSPTGQTNSADGSASSGTTGTSPQLIREDGTADGSVTVTYTPAEGGPTVSATVSNACAGTIYRTGVLASS
ncbi:hypothetical protein [Streptomyces sp. NPDC018693]|uniref:hypothetical protein n=1 Tax=unclassified Streptomyces TaxID=2593676 RepID=UPI0037A12EE3